jgi:uncharacterized protein
VKYLLVLLVVGFGLWTLLSRLRGGGADAPPPGAKTKTAKPVVMVQCAHCGLHLSAADALPEGSRLYCSDDHRRLGPAASPPP